MRWLVTVLAVAIAGCASSSGSLYPDQPLTPFAEARRDSAAHEGELARWEGLIADVQNQPRRSRIEMVYIPLDRQGKPKDEQSQGRFVAYLDGFVDPLIYSRGRSITVLGTIAAPESGRVGEYEMALPVLMVKEHKLWERVKEVEIRYVDPWFYDGPYHRW